MALGGTGGGFELPVSFPLRFSNSNEPNVQSGPPQTANTPQPNEANSLDVVEEQKSHWQLKAAASATRKLDDSLQTASVDRPHRQCPPPLRDAVDSVVGDHSTSEAQTTLPRSLVVAGR